MVWAAACHARLAGVFVLTMFLCNNPHSVTKEAQENFCLTHYGMFTRPSPRVVMLEEKCKKQKVALVTGGGSGHEPFAAGYIGRGMITASVAGDLYSSPPGNAVETAVNACFAAGYESVLLLVLNYTGDRLTFGLAQRRSPKADMFIMSDDCTTKQLRIGARGLAGTLFYCKIAGAMAYNGCSNSEIKAELESLKMRIQTIGVCLQACTLPGKAGHILEIDHGYAELGLGIHGEAGVEKIKVSSCDDLVGRMIVSLAESLNMENKSHNNRFALLVNNLGGMSQVELNLITGVALRYLSDNYSICPARLFVGTYMTSLDAKGFSLSLFETNSDELGYLDAETNAAVWLPSRKLPPPEQLGSLLHHQHQNGHDHTDIIKMPRISEEMAEIIRRVANRLIEMADRLNYLDGGGMGDSDTGSTLTQMFQRLLSDLESNKPDPATETSLDVIAAYLYYLSKVAEVEMGGTSGGLYAFGLQAAGDAVKTYIDGEMKNQKTDTLSQWCDVVDSALWAVQFLGGAQPGDRSLVDPLQAIVDCVDLAKHDHASSVKGVLLDSALAADKAVAATTDMKARVGRAAAAREVACLEKHPDPGATALAAIWSELVSNL